MNGGAGDTRGDCESITFGVVIADNDDHVREALAHLVHDHPRLHLIGEAMDGLQAAELCGKYPVHIAVVDVRMPHGGAEAIKAIKSANPDTIVAAYTTLTDRRTCQRLLDAGAAAVFGKGGGLDIGDELAKLAAP